MSKRTDLRTSEAEWRRTSPHAPKRTKPTPKRTLWQRIKEYLPWHR